MEFKAVGTDLLRAIRGPRSQNFLNRKMGFNYNQVSKWERGTKPISWLEFQRICTCCGIDISSALRITYGVALDPTDFSALIRHFVGDRKAVEAATGLGISRFKLRRWLNGESCPNLEDVLKIIHKLSASLLPFVSHLAPIDNIPSLLPLSKQTKELKQIIFDHPHALAVWSALRLQEFRDADFDAKVIARHLDIPSTQVEAILSTLQRTDQIERRGKEIHEKTLRIDIRNDFQGKNRLRRFWVKEALQMLDAMERTTERSQFGFFTYAASESARLKIIEAYHRFYQELQTILDTDHQPKATVQILNLQILDCTERAQILGEQRSRPMATLKN